MAEFVDEARAKRLKFRNLLTRKEMTVMTGGFSPLLAVMAERVGFEAFFVAGSQMSGFLYAVPDTGVIGLRDIIDHGRHIAARTTIPIMLDCDTAFGNATNVWFTVEEVVRAGLAGLQIEDQEAPKKSGTGGGRRCIGVEEAVGKYKAAVAARNSIDPSFVICARTDSVGSEGGGIDDAITRCNAYLKDGGVDFVWLNAIETLDDVKRAAKEIAGPVLLTGGASGVTSLDDYRTAGIKIFMHPTLAASGALRGAWEALHAFHDKGLAGLKEWGMSAKAYEHGAADFRHFNRNDMIKELEAQFMPSSLQRDYVNTFGLDSPTRKPK